MSSSTHSLPVSSVSSLTRVTVPTLHHYDQIGLLVPSDRRRAGYRLYGKADLQRLRQILLYCELGFALEEIAELPTISVPPSSRKPTG
jgi:DNA-binding transcriptional MerR regulator